MEINQVYNISLNTNEACALKKMLGCVTDIRKKEVGLNSDDIERMRALYNRLPDEEECATD